jgi:acetyl esterase/lipase
MKSTPCPTSCLRRHGPAALLLVLLSLPACRLTDVTLWGPPPPPEHALPVRRVSNVAYYEGPGADPTRHRLDLFLPAGAGDYPVVLLVHGGAWVVGDNRCCGLYPAVGEFLARQGIAAVLPNYRLSPGVRHPEHVRDLARAFAWVRAHIAEYGGSADQIFLAGHSAGGHLVALLAADQKYLRAEGLRTADVRGVVCLSGVYRLPAGKLDVTLGGAPPRALRLDELAPLRGFTDWSWARLPAAPGIPLRVDVFGPAFGEDPDVRADASPINHVRPGLPPFLVVCAEKDLPTLPAQAEEFHRALLGCGCEAHFLRVPNRNHHSVVFRAIEPEDPVAAALLEFIRQHVVPLAKNSTPPRTSSRSPGLPYAEGTGLGSGAHRSLTTRNASKHP